MRIAVVELWPTLRHHSVDIENIPATPYRNLLYIPIPPQVDPHTIHSSLKHLPSALKGAADFFIIRPQPSDLASFKPGTELISRILHRLNQKPGFVLWWDTFAHQFTPLVPPFSLVGDSESAILDAVRRAETSLLLQLPGATLPDVPDIHYQGPNGSHYDSFARPGLAIRSFEGLDGICFWLQKHLTETTTVLVDSWSLLSLGVRLQRLAGDSIERVESLQNYHESSDLILGRIVGRRTQLPKRILLIISVSSTGRLAERLIRACHEGGCKDIAIVSLFAVTTCEPHLKGDVFCPLGAQFRPTLLSDCRKCPNSVLVKIEPTSYLMEISATAKEVRITQTNAEQARDFLNRYHGTDYLTVHRDQHDKQRHHMIHVDVSRLMSHEAFRIRFHAQIERIRDKVDIIISPDHDVAKRLAGEVRAALNLPQAHLVIANDQAIDSLRGAERELISRCRGILIVDDVVITGDRFWSYRNSLETSGLTAPGREVHFLVGLERTPDEATLKGVRDAAHGPGNFHFIESLTLPNWGKDECPWCWELSELERFGEQVTDSPLMRNRYRSLRHKSVGLSSDIFLHWGTDGSRPKHLGPSSSVYGNLEKDVEVFVAVASVIQKLRSIGDLYEQSIPPAARILDPELTLVGRYYAAVLTASVLRSTRRHDLRSTTSDARLLSALSRRLETGRVPELRSELLFAMARDRVPLAEAVLRDPDFMSKGEEGVTHFLRLMLKLPVAADVPTTKIAHPPSLLSLFRTTFEALMRKFGR